jgi:hypothetical protein
MDKNKENPIHDNKEKGELTAQGTLGLLFLLCTRTAYALNPMLEGQVSMATHELIEASSQIWTEASIAQSDNTR